MNAIAAKAFLLEFLLPSGLNVCPQDTGLAYDSFAPSKNGLSTGIPLRGGPSRTHASLCRTLPPSGICVNHLLGKLSRHRNLYLVAVGQVVPYRQSLDCKTLHLGRSHRASRLSHLRGVRTMANCANAYALRGAKPGTETVEHGLSVGFDYHRRSPVDDCIGNVCRVQEWPKRASAFGYAWRYSKPYPRLRGQAARCQGARCVDSGSCGDLHDESGRAGVPRRYPAHRAVASSRQSCSLKCFEQCPTPAPRTNSLSWTLALYLRVTIPAC